MNCRVTHTTASTIATTTTTTRRRSRRASVDRSSMDRARLDRAGQYAVAARSSLLRALPRCARRAISIVGVLHHRQPAARGVSVENEHALADLALIEQGVGFARLVQRELVSKQRIDVDCALGHELRAIVLQVL